MLRRKLKTDIASRRAFVYAHEDSYKYVSDKILFISRNSLK
jgi:hypothetical protein